MRTMLKMYTHSNSYGHDDLAPLSGGKPNPWVDSRNGWGATIVDSLSTMKVMGLDVSEIFIFLDTAF